jgi:hypothetical protein
MPALKPEAPSPADITLQMLLHVAHLFTQRAHTIRAEGSVDSRNLSPSYQLSKVIEALADDIRQAVDQVLRGTIRHLDECAADFNAVMAALREKGER